MGDTPSEPYTVERFRLATSVDVRNRTTSDRTDDRPEDLPEPPRAAEFLLEVVVEGLPLGEMSAGKPDSLRRRVQGRLKRLEPVLLKEFEDEVHRLAARRLGERGWLVSSVTVEIGSFKITAAFLVGFQLLTNYGALRESIDYLHQDLTTYAIPFAQKAARQLLDLETPALGVSPEREPTGGAAALARPPAAVTLTDAELANLIREVVRDELKAALRNELRVEGSAGEEPSSDRNSARSLARDPSRPTTRAINLGGEGEEPLR